MSATEKREKEVFERAIEIASPSERAAYIESACADNADLAERIRALLQAHDQAGFLPGCPEGGEALFSESTVSEAPGTVIGRYKLLEKIGEGGMAVVYLAEQTEPLRRKVALKIIKLGMDTRQVIARFEAERQALALMDHPSIAKVLDAGATETGRPYFVMELVQGVSITEYCDKNVLNTKERLSLFLQVCQAVQHAHTKGIIHRDIKPSNVMVTHHDGRPIPKVIDFGIAKATNQKLTEKTLFTRYAHLIGTPAYMSPEQAELSDLDIDTRSDIYSLGVLLYELLTGTTPFSEEELRKAGYVEMQRVIREQEPVKPSTRIKTALRSMGVPSMKSQGHLGPAGTGETPVILMGKMPMLREVRGDLDWIVMKSLEKDRVRRYETASGLAEDIRRHLESEPVLARGPTVEYRIAKFLRRHRSQVLAGVALAVMGMMAGGTLLLWNRSRAQMQELQLQAQKIRLQVEEGDNRALLSQAQEQHARAEYDAALETIGSISDSPHVGREAQLLRAGILVDTRRPDEARRILENLLSERAEIAGAAHSLLARILWESGPLDAEKLQQIGEHRGQAEDLLPETAEAYFLQAMTAVTIKDQLAALDWALRLDGKHYESRRLRAFTYYASRRYGPMSEDASVLEAMRDRDPLGYSLRATALGELGRYDEAVTEYDRAMSLMAQGDAQYLDLAIQRSEVLLRMGSYERIVAEAQAHTFARGANDVSPLQYHLFCALTALGDYEKAGSQSRQITAVGEDVRWQFQNWCAKYVFDSLHAGRAWHPSGREPVGAAFLSMVEAQETYRELSAKARRIITGGFGAEWSPDGKKLAFSLRVQGYSGVAVFDLAMRRTDLLIVPGKNPRWSPDGRYLAFVRDGQLLRVPEIFDRERKNQHRTLAQEEVWLMRSDGTEPRLLAQGGSPAWDRNSTSLYFHSRQDYVLCSISIDGRDAEPKRIMACPGAFPALSPDNQRVAYLEDTSLKVKDLSSQTLIAEWPVPWSFSGGGTPVWSPSGSELCLGGGSSLQNRTGLWIYRLDRSEPIKTLGGPITVGRWAPDAAQLVFSLGSPYDEIWAADVDARLSTIEALGPGRTLAEHFREGVAFFTRRIEADPLDADSYLHRAGQHQYPRDDANARADMRRYQALLNRGSFSDSGLQGPWTLVCAVHGLFGRQLVIFLEKQEDGLCVLRLAFGSRGRHERKPWEIPLIVTSLLGPCLLGGIDTPPARADLTFGTPTSLGPTVNSTGGNCGPCVSADGLELYFHRRGAGR